MRNHYHRDSDDQSYEGKWQIMSVRTTLIWLASRQILRYSVQCYLGMDLRAFGD